MPKIGVIGAGYVGLVQGACLSDFGSHVIVADIDAERIKMLQNGLVPNHEPELEEIIRRNVYYRRLEFTTDMKKLVESSDVIFIAVGTPSADDGSVDLSQVYAAARTVAKYINGYKVIATKSTVPVGTGKKLRELIAKKLNKRGQDHHFDIISNPEFLREGAAVYDFTHPDRIVIGTDSSRAREMMREVYKVLLINKTPLIETNMETAEMIKYACNAFLALKVTFVNEIANLCERVNASIQEVAAAMGKDHRIGPDFLNPGPGYGGSCFPKDTRALARMGLAYSSDLSLVDAVIEANERQKKRQAERIAIALGDLGSRRIAVLGLAFKPNTDDMREAPSITILKELVRRGARLQVYDPAAMERAKSVFTDIEERITYCSNEYEAIAGSDAVVIITEWDQFKKLDLERIKTEMRQPFFFDLRNIYERRQMEAKGFHYYGIGQ